MFNRLRTKQGKRKRKLPRNSSWTNLSRSDFQSGIKTDGNVYILSSVKVVYWEPQVNPKTAVSRFLYI